MQGGGDNLREEYSTYEQDKAELDARHKTVDVSGQPGLNAWLYSRLSL